MADGSIAVDEAGPTDRTSFIGMLVGFGDQLRAAGVPIGSGDLLTFCAAMALLDPGDVLDLYWAGRTSLVARHDHIPIYDRVFRSYFLDHPDDLQEPARAVLKQSQIENQSVIEVPFAEPAQPGKEEEGAPRVDGLRHRDLAKQGLLGVYRRRARRLAPHHESGEGDPSPPPFSAHGTVSGREPTRPPPHGPDHDADPRRAFGAVLAAAAAQDAPARPHPRRVGLDGRVLPQSPPVRLFDPAGGHQGWRCSASAPGSPVSPGPWSAVVPTTLSTRRRDRSSTGRVALASGYAIDTFVRQWGRRGMSRGAIVVICSDGLDRGDPALLAAAMERLSRLCHKVVWMNPHKGNDPEFIPTTLGMMVAAPYVDLILSGHDLASLEELAERLPELR